MEEALYGEGGYYNRPSSRSARGGDFVTGSAPAELFGRATARLLDRLDELSADRHDARGRLRRRRAPRRRGGGRSARRLLGWDRMARPAGGVERLEALDELAEPVDGMVFSYELFDALPVHRLIGRGGWAGGALGRPRRRGRLRLAVGPLSDAALALCLGGSTLETGQVADVLRAGGRSTPSWPRSWARAAGHFDYGYERRRLFDPRVRPHGTLACYRSHRVHRDALSDVGEQDLTAHVDFTTLCETGEAAGLETFAFTRQARWLIALDLFSDLEGAPDLQMRQRATTLLDPEGMGDQIRVLVQGRGIDAAEVFDVTLLGGVEPVE